MKNNNKIIVFILILFFLIKLMYNNRTLRVERFSDYNINNIKNIWVYWENMPNTVKPAYLDLCLKTVLIHNKDMFKIHVLNEKNVYEYLPKIRKDIFKILAIPQKTDYIRLMLLNVYGGIWLDSDIIVMKNLFPILKKLETYDFVGFGCHSRNCNKKTNGYPKPANWVLASRKNGKLVSQCLKEADKILDTDPHVLTRDYHKLGRKLLWSNIDNLLKTDKNWSYYHYDSRCIERDSNGNKLINRRSISMEKIDKECSNKYLFIPIYNTAPGFPKWFRDMDTDDILKSNMLISKLFRKSILAG